MVEFAKRSIRPDMPAAQECHAAITRLCLTLDSFDFCASKCLTAELIKCKAFFGHIYIYIYINKYIYMSVSATAETF